MIITKTKITEACAKKDDRPVLTGVHYNANKKRLEATDGFILAIAPVSDVEDRETESRIVPTDVVKAAQKGRRSTPAYMLLLEDGARVPFDGDGVTPYVEGTFPDVELVIPKRSEIEYVGSLDANLLRRLALAVCEDRNTLHVSLYRKPGGDGSDPFLVISVSLDWEGPHGAIMPVYQPIEKRGATTAEIEDEIMNAGYELVINKMGGHYRARAVNEAYDINVGVLETTRMGAIRQLRGKLHALDIERGKPKFKTELWRAYQGTNR